MRLSDFKNFLNTTDTLNFVLPTGISIPSHFHITEAGLATKHVVDCGGKIRKEKRMNFQIWVADDVEHRLTPEKLLGILKKSEKLTGEEDLEIEVEYQMETIGKFGLAFDGRQFVLTPKQTDCLAKDRCGVSEAERPRLSLSASVAASSPASCRPGSGCC